MRTEAVTTVIVAGQIVLSLHRKRMLQRIIHVPCSKKRLFVISIVSKILLSHIRINLSYTESVYVVIIPITRYFFF